MDDCIMDSAVKLKELLGDLLDSAKQLNITIYLVGGSVRDALLNLTSFDLDFVVNDKIEAFGNHLKVKYNIKPSKLKTLNFQVDTYNVDIAMFRSEKYTGYSGLPILASGSFEEDLWRRDFTINTAYVKIDDLTIQKLLTGHLDAKCIYKSHPNFESDLRSRTLRLVNKNAFLEDPTRLLRAVKYLTVLNLSFEKETEVLFVEAINLKIIQNCSLGRYKNIIYKYTELSAYKAILNSLYKYDLLRGNPDKRFFNDMGEDVIKAFPEAKHSIFIMLALYVNDIEFAIGIDRQLTDCVNEIKAYKKVSMVDEKSNYIWYKILKKYKVETLMYLLYSDDLSAWEKSKIIYFYKIMKDINVSIAGKDVLDIGIPAGQIIGQLIEELLEYKVHSGLRMSKTDEIKWIERKYYAN